MTAGNDQMVLADNILAFKLLKSAGLSEEEEKLVFTAINTGGVSFKNMKSALKRVFSNTTNASTSVDKVGFDCVAVKQEALFTQQEQEALYTQQRRNWNREKSNMRKESGSSSSGNISKSSPYTSTLNPLDKKGEVSRCLNCESIMHWIHRCLHPIVYKKEI